MKKKVVIIGGGINGLVAANYLQKSGFDVTILERKKSVGGACSAAVMKIHGRSITYPNGASVLGFMQDFVFKDTGLKEQLVTYTPNDLEVLYFSRHAYRDTDDNWTGAPGKFARDMEKVRRFLIRGYKIAHAPTLEEAEKVLGKKMASLWISGSAYELLNHYKLSEEAKIHIAMSVNESGPVSMHEPYSAFNIPLMASGSVFGGKWGYVKGGIWQVTNTIARLNKSLGVRIIFEAKVITTRKNTITYEKHGMRKQIMADVIIFATDPLSAATMLRDNRMIKIVRQKRMKGTSGKIVLFFRRPVKWEGGGDPASLRYVVSVNSVKEMNRRIISKNNFSAVYFEIYGEGAARRMMGEKLPHDYVTVFFKSIRGRYAGSQLPRINKQIEGIILSRIVNRKDFITSIMLTPRDLKKKFFFPSGNIDHIELCNGQTFFQRTYSPQPSRSFYQFGSRKNVFYCGAGAYPCGSVSGTPGYMCAKQIIKNFK